MSDRQQGFGPRSQVFKIRQDNLDANRQSEPMVDLANSQSESPYTNANLIEDIELLIPANDFSSAFTPVRHQLGREYRGWHVVRNDSAFSTFIEDRSGNAKKDTQILLRVDRVGTQGIDSTIKISITVF